MQSQGISRFRPRLTQGRWGHSPLLISMHREGPGEGSGGCVCGWETKYAYSKNRSTRIANPDQPDMATPGPQLDEADLYGAGPCCRDDSIYQEVRPRKPS